jgi:integrase
VPKLNPTTEAIRNAQQNLGTKRYIELCDTVVLGLHANVSKTSATFYFRFKDLNGKTNTVKIARTNDITLEKAREIAAGYREMVRNGDDPRLSLPKYQKHITLDALFDGHYLPYIKTHNRSWKNEQYSYNKLVRERFGDYPLNQLQRRDVEQFHVNLLNDGLTPATCDHYVKMLRRMLNKAVDWGFLQHNHLSGIQLYNADNRVENILDDEQFSQLIEVLVSHPNRPVCNIILHLLLTGARSAEVRYCQWQDLDLNRCIWTIPSSLSKSKRRRAIVLNPLAVELLQSLRGLHESEYVHVNQRTGEPYKDIKKSWASIKEAAGISTYRLHDLRHQHATILIISGRTLYEVQQLLGHSSPVVTERYAHLTARRLQEASGVVSNQVRQLQSELQKTRPALRLVTKR